MPQYRYKARHRTSRKLVNGTLEAPSIKQATKVLRDDDLLVLKIYASQDLHFSVPILNRVGNKDRVLFTRQFAVMMRAGLPIMSALRAIEEQTTNKTLKTTVGQIGQDIQGGTNLSQSFAKYPRVFPPVFASVAKIGERAGKLEEVLERLATQLEKDAELVGKVRSAMIYPAFVLSSLIVVIILIMLYVIPQLKVLFDDVALELPLITRILLVTSDLMGRYFALVATVIVGLGILFRLIIAKSVKVARVAELIRLKIPIFGRLYRQMMMARFTHTLATLLGAGLPMIEAMKTTATTLNSPIYSQSIEAMTKAIESGQPISRLLVADNNFPPMIGHMAAIGEKSGNLDEVLTTIAGFFDQEVEGLTRNLSALLEPILMIIMAIGVGIVVASVIVPIYNLVSAV